ncbi:hypothetical protein NPA07_05525 [Mycoplasmopsis caviae]|uniref:Uncharacterized protein n=1 Tax=Mycoplasmopsis caviae TaxID=55603 RepID=A0A3P8KBL9_9BACT|nr:hypothetical protein [Mycoplasmopsis caviae]UUD35233.1 hypothetical protein NPA07_05525 [Mycoplasmopsis caviae]VDR41984.1 Uncharacterised protein [Mycoplasmopsis caviae]
MNSHSNNPFYYVGTHQLNAPYLVLFIFGILFILIGITSFFFYPSAKEKAQFYKEKQMEEYKKNNPKSKVTNYEATGMYLPAWERIKLFAPIFFGILLVVVGVTMIVRKTITTL